RMVDAPTIFLFSSFFFYVGGFYPCSTRKFYQTKNKISKPYIPTPKVEGFTAKIGKIFRFMKKQTPLMAKNCG
ncbi:MAG: hypothetical protein IJT58_00155, partial [Synergistaceae bacterium]|nr:hypothetical protein [Synergistaceae bacterium]